MTTPGTTPSAPYHSRRSVSGTLRSSPPLTLTDGEPWRVSSSGVSIRTSTVSPIPPTFMITSTWTVRPVRTTTDGRLNVAKPVSSAVMSYSPGARSGR